MRSTKTKTSKYSSTPQPSRSQKAKFVPLLGGDADGLFLETLDERAAKQVRHLLRDRGGLSIEAIGDLEVDNNFMRIPSLELPELLPRRSASQRERSEMKIRGA